MKSYVLKITALVLLTFATSCASTKYFSIDVLQPARVNFAENVVNIAIVDNAGVELNDSIVDSTNSDIELATSLGKNAFKTSLATYMDEEKFFNSVMLYPKVIRTDKRYGQQIPLMKGEVQNIAREMDVDAVVSLDGFETNSNESLVRMDGWTFNMAKAKTVVLFRVYDAQGSPIPPIMATEDSIAWMGDRGTQFINQEYYVQLSQQLAETTTKQLIPYWESQERWYYMDGTKWMKEANKHLEKGEWAQAAVAWGQAYDAEKDNRKKAKIASNIALANENLNDMENAVVWIKTASNLLGEYQKSDQYKMVQWYKIKLLEREQNNPKVLNQMGIEPAEE